MKRLFLTIGGAALLALSFASVLPAGGMAASQPERLSEEQRPITLKTMGSLFFGGTVTKTETGETFHGDHGYAQY